MKKKSVLFGMFLLICCLWISSCQQEEVVIEQPSLEKSEKEETDKADGKEEKSSQESEPEAETIWVDVSGAVNRPGAVSYTHLDVYKRQSVWIPQRPEWLHEEV